MDTGSFEKLQVNWAALSEIMQAHGGADVFGSWSSWSNPFDLRHLQQHWEDKAFCELFALDTRDMNQHVRHTVVTLI